MRIRIFSICLAVSALVASASADTMKFLGTGYGRNAKISLDYGSDYDAVFSGVLNMRYTTSTGSITLDGFCATSEVSMASGSYGVTRTDSSIRGVKGLHAGYLVNKYAPAIFEGGSSGANKDKAFALQGALWEILTETTSTLSISSGSFRMKNADGSSLTTTQKNLINGFLSDYGQDAATYYRSAVDSHNKPLSQSILTPVPEPATLAALSIGALGFLRRRIRKP